MGYWETRVCLVSLCCMSFHPWWWSWQRNTGKRHFILFYSSFIDFVILHSSKLHCRLDMIVQMPEIHPSPFPASEKEEVLTDALPLRVNCGLGFFCCYVSRWKRKVVQGAEVWYNGSWFRLLMGRLDLHSIPILPAAPTQSNWFLSLNLLSLFYIFQPVWNLLFSLD